MTLLISINEKLSLQNNAVALLIKKTAYAILTA